MKYQDLDKEEEQILNDFEKGDFKSVSNVAKEKKRHAQIAKNTLDKSANVNLRLSKRDIYRVKAKAIEKGIPYQTILASLIHQYASGKVKLEM